MSDSGQNPPANVRPGGRDVEIFNDEIFRELRSLAQVPDDFTNAGWDLEALKHGGGKGGTLMAHIGSLYIIKELSKGDHAALLQVTNSYAQHVKGGETLITPIYLHFRDIKTERFFFAMKNSIGNGPFRSLYDLKGCADDKSIVLDGKTIKAVHKRIWNVGMWCGKLNWTEERLRYYEGKQLARNVQFAMTAEQRSNFLEALNRDAAWLASQQLMDYSLLVSVKEGPQGSFADDALQGHRPLRRQLPDGREIVLTLSIIDILQKWTNGKKVARCIKAIECDKATIPPDFYASRFSSAFKERSKEAAADESADLTKVPRSVAPPAGQKQ